MSKNKEIDPLSIHKLLKQKSFVINFRMNPKLVKILDDVIEKDDHLNNRSDWFEDRMIKYVMEKGGLY